MLFVHPIILRYTASCISRCVLSICGRRIMVITQASQACDAGSIPVARSRNRTAMVDYHCRFFVLAGRLVSTAYKEQTFFDQNVGI